jgi:hypothetical protein
VYTVTPGTFVDFVDGVVPVLQERGLMQREYGPGTLRRRVLGEGDRLPDRHPGAAYRYDRRSAPTTPTTPATTPTPVTQPQVEVEPQSSAPATASSAMRSSS